MSIKLTIYLGFLVVLFTGALTMTAGYTKIYSPYSFIVVIPVFVLSVLALPSSLLMLLASLPNALLFLLSTRSITNENLKISRLLPAISAFLVLSLALITKFGLVVVEPFAAFLVSLPPFALAPTWLPLAF